MKFWMIVNVEDADKSPHGYWKEMLPVASRPSQIYHIREEAEAELARLARKLGQDCYLLESVAVGTQIQTQLGRVGRVDPLPGDQVEAAANSTAARRRKKPR